MVYVGGYTDGEGQGIRLFRMDLASGKLTPAGVGPNIVNPSFLALHPGGRMLYAVSEVGSFHGQKTGAVSGCSINPADGSLTLVNAQSSGGAGPCHVTVDRLGKNVLVANYSGGSVAVLPVDNDGRLREPSSIIQHHGSSVDPKRQEGPHAHSINLDSANRFAFAADLGLDAILIYRFDPDHGTLTPNDPASVNLAPGAGPRHFAFHPGGRTAYAINELNSTVTAFNYDPEAGSLREIQSISTLPDTFKETNYPAEIRAHPTGRFLYGSNRGHDSIAIFRIDPASGRLTAAGHRATGGKNPRNFRIDPTGRYLLAANQASSTIVVFRIDPETGDLTPTGETAEAPTPVCVVMLPITVST